MASELKELWRYRELLWILVRRDIDVRYKNSRLGFAWSLLNPLLQVLVITVVLKYIMRMDIQNYSAYIFCAFLPWSFFQLSLLDASTSLLLQDRLIKKVYFPREIIPLSVVISNLIHFGLATLVFLGCMAVLPLVWWPVTGRFEWSLLPTLALAPAAMVIEFFLVAGLALFVSATNVFYEDVRYLLTVGLQILYYAVPVIYFSELVRDTNQVPPDWRGTIYSLYMLNPLSAIITAFRKWILVPTNFTTHSSFQVRTDSMTGSDYVFLAAALVSSLLIALAGYAYFNRRKWKFAERP
jgi:homopolymeric O-antigen transport system permease protein